MSAFAAIRVNADLGLSAAAYGFASYIVGYVRSLTGNFQGGLLAVSALGAIGMIVVLCLPIGRVAPESAGAASPTL